MLMYEVKKTAEKIGRSFRSVRLISFAVTLTICLHTNSGYAQVLSDSGIRQLGAAYVDAAGGSGCSNSGAGIDTSSAKGGTSEGFTIEEVKTFASEPVSSTWDIDEQAAEKWFLKQSGARATIAKYGLTAGNIGTISSAVKEAGVSPIFFYLYTVNEGGGAGGFINHYSGDVSGGGPGNAKHDAEYLVSQSKETKGKPATGGGEPGDLPTAEAQQILSALPAGSIGVVYIQATSAVTAELEDLSGKTGGWSGKYGKPLSDAMKNIKSLGGDPLKGGSTISTDGCATSGLVGAGMQKGISFAVSIAKNDGYGYDQPTRESGWEKWKSDPSCTKNCGSFDCSSFVSAILTVAGYFKGNPNFDTSGEAAKLEEAGFKKVADSAKSSEGLKLGDVLLANGHTEMYIGNGKDVAASQNESGGTKGGQTGDQTGKEVFVRDFYDDGWIGVYRAQN